MVIVDDCTGWLNRVLVCLCACRVQTSQIARSGVGARGEQEMAMARALGGRERGGGGGGGRRRRVAVVRRDKSGRTVAGLCVGKDSRCVDCGEVDGRAVMVVAREERVVVVVVARKCSSTLLAMGGWSANAASPRKTAANDLTALRRPNTKTWSPALISFIPPLPLSFILLQLISSRCLSCLVFFLFFYFSQGFAVLQPFQTDFASVTTVSPFGLRPRQHRTIGSSFSKACPSRLILLVFIFILFLRGTVRMP